MKKILCILAVLLLVPAVFCAGAAEEEDWAKAPVITKAYEQSVGKIYIEWEGNAPLYQVFVDGNKVTDTPFNHQILNAGKGTHSIIVYPVYVTDIDSDTKFNINLDAFGLGGGNITLDLATLGLDPKEFTPGNPSRTLEIDYKPNQIMNARPERLSAVTDSQNRVVLSFEDPYVADEYLLTIKRGSNMSYVTFNTKGEAEKELISENGSMVSLILDPEFLRSHECFVPEIDGEYRFTVQFRKYATDYTTGEKEGSVVSDSKVSAELVYRLAPLWKTAPVITFASQTADGQLTVAWDHEDYGTGVEYAVMKINKVLGIATGEERLGSTKGHEFVVRDLNNGGYCINIVPTLKGEKGSYSADANIEIKNEWVLAPTLSCEQLNGNQVRLTWKAPGNIEKYHITVYRGDNASLLRFVDLDFGKYAEFDVEAAEGDMEYIYTYDEPTDPENGIRLKFEIYGARSTTSGGEQHSAVSGKTIIIK